MFVVGQSIVGKYVRIIHGTTDINYGISIIAWREDLFIGPAYFDIKHLREGTNSICR